MASNCTTTVNITSSIPGAPLNSTGQLGPTRTLSVNGLNVNGTTVPSVGTSPAVVPVGSTAPGGSNPVVLCIRSNEVPASAGGSGLTILFSTSSSTSNVIPIVLPPGMDILLNVTGALYAYTASGTTSNGYWVGAMPSV